MATNQRHEPRTVQRSGRAEVGSGCGWLEFVARAQLAIDTTLVSPLSRDGSASRRAANHDGAAPQRARRRKEATYPELSGEGGQARLVVLAAEVGGRWSVETAQFLSALAKAKAQSAPHLLQGRVRRWSATLAYSAARSFAVSLLDRRPVPGTGDAIPSAHEVMGDDRFAWELGGVMWTH